MAKKFVSFLGIADYTEVFYEFNGVKTTAKVKFVQEQLLELKGFPLTTENDKNLKIAAIFEKIALISPSYVLVNLNDESNGGSIELSNQLEKYKDNLLLVAICYDSGKKEYYCRIEKAK